MSMTNCPNCGAPIVNDKCPYCGTMHELPTPAMAIGKVAKLRFEHDNIMHEMDVRIDNFTISSELNTETFYADGAPVYISTSPDYYVSVSGKVVPR